MKVYLIAIAKMENLYIREFVEHYKALNVDKIILYDNNDNEGLDVEYFEEVINDYIQSGFVQLMDVRGINPPIKCGMYLQAYSYLDAYNRFSNECDWICYFDADEFLTLDEKYNNDIKNFLSDEIFNDFEAIKIPWRVFDDNGLIYYDKRPLKVRFTHASDYNEMQVKTIARTKKKVSYINVHGKATPDFKSCNTLGLPCYYVMRRSGCYINNVCQNNAYLAHYRFKTIQEYMSNKRKRGYPLLSGFKRFKKYNDDFFFLYNERTPEKEAFIKSYGTYTY